VAESPRPGPRYRVELVIDGKRTPIRAFLHDVVGGAVDGMISGLEGGRSSSLIELRVERRSASQDASEA
jgi:hypothetical protein